jgi:hypothetical protein
MVVVAIPDQVRWLSLRAVALSGVLEEPLVGRIGNISRKQSVSMG